MFEKEAELSLDIGLWKLEVEIYKLYFLNYEVHIFHILKLLKSGCTLLSMAVGYWQYYGIFLIFLYWGLNPGIYITELHPQFFYLFILRQSIPKLLNSWGFLISSYVPPASASQIADYRRVPPSLVWCSLLTSFCKIKKTMASVHLRFNEIC